LKPDIIIPPDVISLLAIEKAVKHKPDILRQVLADKRWQAEL
jgi:hypothetical protein